MSCGGMSFSIPSGMNETPLEVELLDLGAAKRDGFTFGLFHGDRRRSLGR